ncbi:MAG: ABC transporter permease [Thiotrichaceae bacterium]|nr:ABC transporter permease [Thiotrichaceae bacterium]
MSMTAVNLFQRYLRATYSGLIKPLQAAYQHRYLLLLLIRRDVTTRTSGTWFGDAWLLLQPALQIVGFWFLLDVVLQVKFQKNVPFLNYFLIGMLTWAFIAEVLGRSLTVLSEFGSLYRRAVFPVIILPLFPIILSATLYSIVMGVTVGLLEGYEQAPYGVLCILGVSLLLIPICYLLAIMGLFLKDISQVFPFLITVTLYLTPILYMPESLPKNLSWLLVLNPAADVMALVHGGLQGLAWDWGNLLRPLMLWLLLLAPAAVLFRRAEPHVREML